MTPDLGRQLIARDGDVVDQSHGDDVEPHLRIDHHREGAEGRDQQRIEAPGRDGGVTSNPGEPPQQVLDGVEQGVDDLRQPGDVLRLEQRDPHGAQDLLLSFGAIILATALRAIAEPLIGRWRGPGSRCGNTRRRNDPRPRRAV